jgi:hypothetical protein
VSTAERAELRELRKLNKTLEQENYMLKMRIPEVFVHPFRTIPYTDSGVFVHP